MFVYYKNYFYKYLFLIYSSLFLKNDGRLIFGIADSSQKTLFKLQDTWSAIIAIALFHLFITAILKWFPFGPAFWVTYQEAWSIVQYVEFNNKESTPLQNLCNTTAAVPGKMWNL